MVPALDQTLSCTCLVGCQPQRRSLQESLAEEAAKAACLQRQLENAEGQLAAAAAAKDILQVCMLRQAPRVLLVMSCGLQHCWVAVRTAL